MHIKGLPGEIHAPGNRVLCGSSIIRGMEDNFMPPIAADNSRLGHGRTPEVTFPTREAFPLPFDLHTKPRC
jgi:hypothetical protein